MAVKGIVLTLDAIIAFLIMISIVSLLVFFRTESQSPFLESQQMHSLSEDTLTIISESTLGEVTNKTLLNYYLTPPHQILNQSDLDKKAIDVIGALWAANRSEAANITKDILNDIIPQGIGYQLLINGVNVYNSSDTARPSIANATAEISSNRIASGYEFNKSTSGFVARAWASKIKRNVTKIIPINLEWGEYNNSDYWGNGYAPSGERNGTAIIRKNFTIPTDATIFSQYLQLSTDVGTIQVKVNGNRVYQGGGGVIEIDLKKNITSGMNQIEMNFNRTNQDLAHIHPGNYIKIKYNTSEVDSGSNVTTFYSDWIQGSPTAAEIIPFFENSHITNVTAYVDVQDLNAFLLVTLNYKYNRSNPMQNVIIYKNYPSASYCSQFIAPATCQAHSDVCFWNSSTNSTLFHSTFDSWSTITNCSGASTESWNECNVADNQAYWRARIGTGSYNSSSTQYHEANNISTINSTWLTKCMDMSSYSNAYVTFWFNKTATSSSPTNSTLFDATFDGWGSTNCGGAAAEGWSDCVTGEAQLYWNATTGGGSYNTTSIKYFEGNDIDTRNATWITKCMDMSSYSNAYVTFWFNKTATSDNRESHFIMVNRSGAGSFVGVWGSNSSAFPWTYKELNITSYISSYTCVRYMAGGASDTTEKLLLDDFKIIGTNILDNRQFILVNKTGSGFTGIWNSSTSASSWTYKELNITNYISSYTCVRYMAGTVSASEKMLLDDFKLIGTKPSSCNNFAADDVKNRTFEIIFNQTGTLIKEYNSTGLLSTTFTSNVSMNNVYDNMTNTFGIYADIRPPNNSTVTNGNGDVDWQRLGMYANNDTSDHGSDHYCIITDKANVTVYHDLEQYGLEYGKVDISQVANFTGGNFTCQTRNSTNTCKDAKLNLTFPFPTSIITARIIGTQSLAGNDNGYNYVWMWYQGQANETNMVLDSDTPPGTMTYLPIKFFGLNKTNYVRVGDKDPDGRYLLNDPTTFMGWNRSIVEYTFLIPSQVGYGDVFENQTNATNDAIQRLSDKLGLYATSADVQTENYTVSNVPHMWGPASIKIRLWI